jgi:starvation-inducible DNA-binding protein
MNLKVKLVAQLSKIFLPVTLLEQNMKPNIGITEKNLVAVQDILTNVLANASILNIKLRKFHWNVNGPDFVEYHELFEEQYDQINNSIDDIAERISILGGAAIGTAAEFVKHSDLKEAPGKNPTPNEMLKELIVNHEVIIKGLRKAVDDCDEKHSDAGTADLLTQLMSSHEKMAWKLRHYFR